MKPLRYVPSSNPPSTPFEQDLDRTLDKMFAAYFQLLNSGMTLADNFNAFTTTFTTSATPGQETAIAHGLKKIPTGFLILSKNKSAHIFDGPSGKDSDNYFIQSNVASVRVTVVIL